MNVYDENTEILTKHNTTNSFYETLLENHNFEPKKKSPNNFFINKMILRLQNYDSNYENFETCSIKFNKK
jgi:hypothetical protein